MSTSVAARRTIGFAILLNLIGTGHVIYAQRFRGNANPANSASQPCLTTGSSSAATAAVDPKAPAGWGEFQIHVGKEVAKADEKTGRQMIQQLDQLMQGVPALNPVPPGVFIRQLHAVGEGDAYGRELLNAFYFIDFHHPLKTATGNYDTNDAYDGWWIHLNGFLRPFAPSKDDPLPEPVQLRQFAGHPVFAQGTNSNHWVYLLLTKRQQPPWSYLTLREYVEQARAKMEKSAPLVSAPEKIRSDHEKFVAAFNQKAAAFSPAALDAPVYLARQGGGLDGLSTAADPHAFRLVYYNKDFLDPKLPPSAIQFITLSASPVSEPPEAKDCDELLSRRIFNQIDIKALEEMLQ